MSTRHLASDTKRLTVRGDSGNYRLPVTFDYSDAGYLRISQVGDAVVANVVLLSPAQLVALKAFTRRRPRPTP